MSKTVEVYEKRIRMNFDGHICVGSARDEESEIYNILALCVMPEKVKPNTLLPQYVGVKTSDFIYSIELVFQNKKSVQVVMNALKKVKKSMNL